jgi:hypothetical protein
MKGNGATDHAERVVRDFLQHNPTFSDWEKEQKTATKAARVTRQASNAFVPGASLAPPTVQATGTGFLSAARRWGIRLVAERRLDTSDKLQSNYLLNRTCGDGLPSNQSISALGRLARR